MLYAARGGTMQLPHYDIGDTVHASGGTAHVCVWTTCHSSAYTDCLSRCSFMGGNSTKATSGINGAGTQSQQDVGIVDSAMLFFEDTKRSVS